MLKMRIAPEADDDDWADPAVALSAVDELLLLLLLLLAKYHPMVDASSRV